MANYSDSKPSASFPGGKRLLLCGLFLATAYGYSVWDKVCEYNQEKTQRLSENHRVIVKPHVR